MQLYCDFCYGYWYNRWQLKPLDYTAITRPQAFLRPILTRCSVLYPKGSSLAIAPQLCLRKWSNSTLSQLTWRNLDATTAETPTKNGVPPVTEASIEDDFPVTEAVKPHSRTYIAQRINTPLSLEARSKLTVPPRKDFTPIANCLWSQTYQRDYKACHPKNKSHQHVPSAGSHTWPAGSDIKLHQQAQVSSGY